VQPPQEKKLQKQIDNQAYVDPALYDEPTEKFGDVSTEKEAYVDPSLYDAEPEKWNPSLATSYAGMSVNFEDTQNMAKLDLMANAGAYGTVRALGMAGMASGNPLAMTIGGLAYLGTDALAWGKAAVLSGDEDAFWTKYLNLEQDVISDDSVIDKMGAGFVHGTSLFTGRKTPEAVKEITDSGWFLAGDIVGTLARDISFMGMGSKMVKSAELMAMGANNGFIVGATIAGAMNSAVDSYANDGEILHAMRNGLAIGAATGISGAFFLNMFPRVAKNIAPKLLETGLGRSMKTGTEFSAWGLGEEVMETGIKRGLGDNTAEFHIDPITYAAMFALGATGAAMFKSSGVADDMSKIVKVSVNEKTVAEEVLAKRATKGDDFAKILTQTEITNNAIALSPQRLRALGDDIIQIAKQTDKDFRTILQEKLINDARYATLTKTDLGNMEKMISKRFQQ